MILLPRNDEYHEAVQNPRIAFSDVDLAASHVETQPNGLPLPYSGGFTVTYKLLTHNKSWAVRCFHRDIQDLQVRYQAIGTFLQTHKSRYFVEAKYLEKGIRVNGNGYPIIKMQWLEGYPLNDYLSKFCNAKVKIDALITDFLNVVQELENYGIAHGDLQHGNIIIKNDQIFLIDYDGMYLPELSSLKTNEIGHVNYQHPKRSSSDYNKSIDRFSEIVIYLGLKALSIKPSLWAKFDNSENILFRSQDFANLQQSLLIQELLTIPELKPLTERLIGCCYLEFSKLPSLKDFISGNFAFDKNAVGTISITRTQYQVISASEKGRLLEHFGEKIEVVGRLSGKFSGLTYNDDPYLFLNFGQYPYQTFTLVLWQETLNAFGAKELNPTSLVNKWVSVVGVIGSYQGSPQMIVNLPSQIQVLSGQDEANTRLQLRPITTPAQNPVKAKPTPVLEDDFFNTFYKDKPATTPSPPPQPKIPAKIYVPQPTFPTQNTSSQKPYSPQSGNSRNSASNNNAGCLVAVIFAVVGGFIGAAVSNGLWIAGAFWGGILGLWINKTMNK